MPTSVPSAELVLAIDVGTTSVKAALVDGSATVVATGVAAQRIASDGSGRREHDPALTWRAVGRAIDRLWRSVGSVPVIAAIVVTGPRGSFGVARPDGTPNGPMLTWQDRRAAGLVAALIDEAGPGYRAVIGYQPTPSSVLPKLLWLRHVDPGRFVPGWRLVTPQSDVLRRLGVPEPVVDLSVAGHIGLLDVRSQAWDTSMLATWSVPTDALPRLVPPGAVVGRLDPGVARRLSLPSGVPLVAAGSDGICSELGAGVVDPGQVYAYLGTAGAIAGPMESIPDVVDPALVVMPGSIVGRHRLLGLTGAGGSARDWAMTLLRVRDHARYDALVRRSPAGARGVIFLPTLAGAVVPEPDGRARGMLMGLSPVSGIDDVARAVLEGVALEMRAIVRAMAGAIPSPTRVALTGGGSRSLVWSVIVADVLQLPVDRVQEPNPGLRGAAQYAFAALGRFPSALAAAASLAPSSDLVLPDPSLADNYADAADAYALIRAAAHGGVDERLYARAVTLAGYRDATS